MAAITRVLSWAFVVGFIGFAAGFFGPMILSPDSNQGPLLGILITGPLGVVLGFIIGVLRELLGARESSGAVLARIGMLKQWPPSLKARRIIAGIIGVWLGMNGFVYVLVSGGSIGLITGGALIISIVAMYYAATGTMPRWLRR